MTYEQEALENTTKKVVRKPIDVDVFLTINLMIEEKDENKRRALALRAYHRLEELENK